jgi:hypothetical protein
VDPLPELHFWEINLESGEVYRPMSFAEGDGKGTIKKWKKKKKITKEYGRKNYKIFPKEGYMGGHSCIIYTVPTI